MSYRVLISDAQVASRRMLRFAMNMKGFQIVECADAVETLDRLTVQRFDLLLVSLYPQEGAGHSVLKLVHERFRHDELPVLLIGDAILRADCEVPQRRGTVWLDRPFQISALMNLVDSVLVLPHPESVRA